MSFVQVGVGADILFVIAPVEAQVEFNFASRHSSVIRIDFEFEDSAADFHTQAFLACKNGLVLESRQ